ncbi:MAG: hypothetical protein ACRDRN_09340 [Sciscionella sp.]
MPSEETGTVSGQPGDTAERPDISPHPQPEHAVDVPSHAAEDGAPLHPLIDLSRDPTPGVPNHAAHEAD